MKRVGAILLMILLATGGSWRFDVPRADAATNSGVKQQVEELNSEVKQKQDRIKELGSLIAGYRSRITEQESKQTTLENEILLLDNRAREKELGIQRSKTEIELLTLEIQELEKVIATHERRIEKQRSLIAEFLRRVNQADEVSTLDVFLTKPSLSSFFDRIEELKRLESDLGESITDLKDVRESLDETRTARDDRRETMIERQKTLQKEQLGLEAERNFKISLMAATQQSQEEFERIMYELRQQQQSTSDDIAELQERLKSTLDTIDEALARGDVLLNFPLDASNGLTITSPFHDPDYPFRKLFEHPGTDFRASVGTPVKAAAGGYVAWNKTGRMYGNYTMIVHPGGFATVYAHLSRFMAKPDTYVERGQVIGLSGGMPGQAGAGLSTGPHLHFEVRQGGIPVDAENFLPSI
ncbi:peptidoglycan DD-metalloendopeptidase family protein [Patescibacteria group bacterium]|nr:peptidoglycan DD-metalloendopeptidase family protein [Patescibacteria group bacterium]MBU1448589.1 peptidoglycan DD-metalloendopeptidase family protein [Patescibacteria group bacterium]MBU2613269.1 peptidoglycan DD-metalloendopeptidase family protein [Patescibacteria group bacterium]